MWKAASILSRALARVAASGNEPETEMVNLFGNIGAVGDPAADDKLRADIEREAEYRVLKAMIDGSYRPAKTLTTTVYNTSKRLH